MELKTTILFNDVTIIKSTENNTKIIAKSIKITNKTKQRVINKLENIENNFLRVAQIEAKKHKKQNFFNKHKNNN